MQQQEYLVTSDSINLIKEFRGYCWEVDKTGKTTNKPIKKNDHAIDALRYHEMESISTNKGVYNIY
jgi:phage terminase large subunit